MTGMDSDGGAWAWVRPAHVPKQDSFSSLLLCRNRNLGRYQTPTGHGHRSPHLRQPLRRVPLQAARDRTRENLWVKRLCEVADSRSPCLRIPSICRPRAVHLEATGEKHDLQAPMAQRLRSGDVVCMDIASPSDEDLQEEACASDGFGLINGSELAGQAFDSAEVSELRHTSQAHDITHARQANPVHKLPCTQRKTLNRTRPVRCKHGLQSPGRQQRRRRTGAANV